MSYVVSYCCFDTSHKFIPNQLLSHISVLLISDLGEGEVVRTHTSCALCNSQPLSLG